MANKILLSKGVLILILPIITLTVSFLLLKFNLTSIQGVSIILIYSLGVEFFFLFQKNSYESPSVLKTVEIPHAPRDILSMLKKRTRYTGHLINVTIVSAFNTDESLSQTELLKRIKERGIKLSHTAIIKYLKELVTMNVLDCTKGAYIRKYWLTERGKWCHKAIKKCFPKRYLLFVIRHYLGYRRLPPFPQATHKK